MKTLNETLKNPTYDGLYSLKALCESTGDYEKNKPYDFLRLPSIKKYLHKSLVLNELTIRKTQGRNGDTFVCKHLVYRYAMWVSDDFCDLVIDTFDALQNAQTTQDLIDIKNQLDSYQLDLIYREPRHPNTLAVILKVATAKVRPYFDYLVGKNEVERVWVPQPDKAEYRATPESRHIIGHKGKTVLFNETVKDLFPEQIDIYSTE
jgi:hypothetical protein